MSDRILTFRATSPCAYALCCFHSSWLGLFDPQYTIGVAGKGKLIGSVLGEGVAGLGMVPLRYPITPQDFAAEVINSLHSAQFEPSNFSSIGNMKFAGWDIVVICYSYCSVSGFGLVSS